MPFYHRNVGVATETYVMDDGLKLLLPHCKNGRDRDLAGKGAPAADVIECQNMLLLYHSYTLYMRNNITPAFANLGSLK